MHNGDDGAGLGDLSENAPCGYLILNADYRVVRANRTLFNWLGFEPAAVSKMRLHDLLSVGGQMLLESHLAPLLSLKGFFDEVSLELKAKGGEQVPVMSSAVVMRTTDGAPPPRAWPS